MIDETKEQKIIRKEIISEITKIMEEKTTKSALAREMGVGRSRVCSILACGNPGLKNLIKIGLLLGFRIEIKRCG